MSIPQLNDAVKQKSIHVVDSNITLLAQIDVLSKQLAASQLAQTNLIWI